jgi:hypothetical protein
MRKLMHEYVYVYIRLCVYVQGDTKKRELLKNPTKIEEIQQQQNVLTEIEPLQLAF